MERRSSRFEMTRRTAVATGLTAMSALALSACSGGSSSSSGSKTLTVMFWGDQTAPGAWRALGKKFTAANPGVEVKYIYQPAEYNPKLQTLIAARNAPDVFLITTGDIGRFIKAGTIADLAPTYKKLGVDVSKNYLDQAVYRQGDGVYGLSASIDEMVLFYDKAALDKAGVERPPTDPGKAWSWSDFTSAAAKLSNPSASKGWGALMLTDPVVTRPFIGSNGGTWFNSAGTEFTLNSPEAVAVYQAFKQGMSQGAFVPQKNINSLGIDPVLQGRHAALYPGGTWNLPSVMKAWGKDAGMAVLPSFGKPASMSVINPLVASSQSKNPELAAKFIDFVSDAKNNPGAFNALPGSRAASEGSLRDQWLNASNRPDGFEQAIEGALASSIAEPWSRVGQLTDIWNLMYWPNTGVEGFFTGQVTDLQAALTKFKPAIDKMLQS